jgi:hypothetical protein
VIRLLCSLAIVLVALSAVLVPRVAAAQSPPLDATDAGTDVDPNTAPPDVAPAAPPDAGAPEPAKEALDVTRFELEGYVNLGVGATNRPRALPRDRWSYGLRSSVAGIIVRGTPFEHFSYFVHFGVNPEAIGVVSGVDLVDINGDGSATKAQTETRDVTVIPVEEVSISYAPAAWLEFKGGHFYMPFSPGAAIIRTSQMFPTRPEPTQVFMVGADQGLMGSLKLLDERIQVSLGAFNGSSLELRVPQTTPLGPVYTFVLDVHPLGVMPRVEGDPSRGPFRFALGGGTIYRSGVLFDETGYESTRFREVRLDGTLRLSFLGAFLQGEVLRRLHTDDVSGRPAVATGAYVQGSYFVPLPRKLAFAPIARFGVARDDERFAVREITELEAGIAFYPRADLDEPDKLRFILQYDGEYRQPDRDVAHGAVLHAQLRW